MFVDKGPQRTCLLSVAKAAFHRVTDMCHVEVFDPGIWSLSVAPGLTPTESRRPPAGINPQL
jgi:hypothetical protein